MGDRRRVPLVLLGVALAATGCGDHPTVPDLTFPPAVTYDLPPDVLTMVLPATGPQTRWRQGLDTFEQVIARQATAACLAPHGVPPPDGPPPVFVPFRDIPDLPYLEAHGFGAATPPPPASTTSAPAAVSPPVVIGPPADPGAVRNACGAVGTARVEPLRGLTARLNSAWLSGLAPIDTDPGVRDAYRALPGCLHDHEVEAADEEAFFSLLDAAAQTGPDRTRRLDAAYATCMAPIEAAREPLRARLRERIAAAHPAEVTRLRTELPDRVHDLERQTRVRLCFPAV